MVYVQGVRSGLYSILVYKLTELKSKPFLNLARHLSKVRTSLITSKIQARNQRLSGLRLLLSKACQQQNLLANKVNGIELNPQSTVTEKIEFWNNATSQTSSPRKYLQSCRQLDCWQASNPGFKWNQYRRSSKATLEVFQGFQADCPRTANRAGWLDEQ